MMLLVSYRQLNPLAVKLRDAGEPRLMARRYAPGMIETSEPAQARK